VIIHPQNPIIVATHPKINPPVLREKQQHLSNIGSLVAIFENYYFFGLLIQQKDFSATSKLQLTFPFLSKFSSHFHFMFTEKFEQNFVY